MKMWLIIINYCGQLLQQVTDELQYCELICVFLFNIYVYVDKSHRLNAKQANIEWKLIIMLIWNTSKC